MYFVSCSNEKVGASRGGDLHVKVLSEFHGVKSPLKTGENPVKIPSLMIRGDECFTRAYKVKSYFARIANISLVFRTDSYFVRVNISIDQSEFVPAWRDLRVPDL